MNLSSIGRIVGGTVGGGVGGYIGTGVGIAAAGTAIAGTWPLLLVGAAVGSVIGKHVGKSLEDDDAETTISKFNQSS